MSDLLSQDLLEGLMELDEWGNLPQLEYVDPNDVFAATLGEDELNLQDEIMGEFGTLQDMEGQDSFYRGYEGDVDAMVVEENLGKGHESDEEMIGNEIAVNPETAEEAAEDKELAENEEIAEDEMATKEMESNGSGMSQMPLNLSIMETTMAESTPKSSGSKSPQYQAPEQASFKVNEKTPAPCPLQSKVRHHGQGETPIQEQPLPSQAEESKPQRFISPKQQTLAGPWTYALFQSGMETYRNPGCNDDDYTSFVPEQASWSFDNLPDIIYQYKPSPGWLKKGQQQVEKKMHPVFGIPIRIIPCLPDHICSNVEPWLIECWLRTDSRIEWGDILARIQGRACPKWNTLQMSVFRFREDFFMLSWKSRGRKTTTRDEHLVSLLKQKGIDPAKNSTRGLTPGLVDPARGEYGGRIEASKKYHSPMKQRKAALDNSIVKFPDSTTTAEDSSDSEVSEELQPSESADSSSAFHGQTGAQICDTTPQTKNPALPSQIFQIADNSIPIDPMLMQIDSYCDLDKDKEQQASNTATMCSGIIGEDVGRRHKSQYRFNQGLHYSQMETDIPAHVDETPGVSINEESAAQLQRSGNFLKGFTRQFEGDGTDFYQTMDLSPRTPESSHHGAQNRHTNSSAPSIMSGNTPLTPPSNDYHVGSPMPAEPVYRDFAEWTFHMGEEFFKSQGFVEGKVNRHAWFKEHARAGHQQHLERHAAKEASDAVEKHDPMIAGEVEDMYDHYNMEMSFDFE
ncbi:MAG: hypothetical protein M1819_007110 [Sarea resinae]|nr:MAG: hypothetical protein M1819_007110 [Sarea resinae]